MIQAAEERSASGVLDANKPTDSGNYPGAEEMSQESCRPKPARMRSIEDDLLGRLEKALDPQIESLLLRRHHSGGGGEGKDQGKDQDGDKDTDLKRGMDMNKEDLDMEMDHYRGTAGGKATSEARRRVVRRREKSNIQQQSAVDPIMSPRSFGVHNSNDDDQSRDRA